MGYIHANTLNCVFVCMNNTRECCSICLYVHSVCALCKRDSYLTWNALSRHSIGGEGQIGRGYGRVTRHQNLCSKLISSSSFLLRTPSISPCFCNVSSHSQSEEKLWEMQESQTDIFCYMNSVEAVAQKNQLFPSFPACTQFTSQTLQLALR